MPALKKIGAAALAAFGWTSGGGAAAVTASYLQVAGGGGGGGGGASVSAGGGAGGYLTGTTSLTPTLSYTVIVGAGGAGGATAIGLQGSNSSITGLTASVGGGGGGSANSNSGNGGSGGSGGGGAGLGGGTTTGGAATSGQGNAGGNGTNGSAPYPAAGGGGAGAAGSNGSGSTTGAGGVGLSSSISGTSTFYAGGGGGGGSSYGPTAAAGAGGNGGGASGGTAAGSAPSGTANLGGGGGGGYGSGSAATGGNGGSGIVIISYAGAQQFGGGIVTSVGGNTIHTFLTSGTLSPLSSLSASYLIVAGGGGGGNGAWPGGGGAGGMLTGSGVTIDTNSTYLVTVGAGGIYSSGGTYGANGTNSSFSMVTTTAVGGGGGAGGAVAGLQGATGGSGGGGASGGAGGLATSGQGSAGGTGAGGGTNGGGGGGKGGVGGNADGSGNAGAGGVGATSSISGTSTYYAGGGGGYGSATPGAGGNGGGGAGGYGFVPGPLQYGVNGTANTGGGGGGTNQASGSGGSGIVIISYAGSTQQMAGGSVTITGGNVIHTFTSSGYLTPLTYYSNSLRFRSSASAYLNRTPTATGSAQKFTWSGWIKRGKLSTTSYIYVSDTSGAAIIFWVVFNSSDQLQILINGAGTSLVSNAVYRDPAAWYHIQVSVDTTQATTANRILVYVNGSQVTSFSTTNYYSLNDNIRINAAAYPSQMMAYSTGSAYTDGYLSNINFIDGQQLTANSFGTFNSYGVWQPINYGGSYGTNGFYLPFNSGSQTYAAPFNGSSQYLSWTANMAGLQFGTGDFTLEAWVNKSANGTNGYDGLMQYGAASSATDGWYFEVSSSRGIYFVINTSVINYGTWVNDGYWHHVAIVRSGGVVTIYKDGIALLSQSLTTSVPTSGTIGRIGESFNGTTHYYLNGSISNARIVKGTAVYTSNFVPSTTDLTAITNTQLLTLQNATIIDNSTNATAITNNGTVATATAKPLSTAVFQDQSPQGNSWTPNNIGSLSGSTLDYMTDVPTLTSTTAANYCVWNPLFQNSEPNTYTNGNLNGSGAGAWGVGTMAIPSGKFYAEINYTTIASDGSYIGIQSMEDLYADPFPLRTATGNVAYKANGDKSINQTSSAYGATYAANDIIGIAVDIANNTITFYKNNTSQGAFSYTFSSSKNYVFAIGSGGTRRTDVYVANFGQRPFTYTPPSGYVALNTYNL